MSGEGRENVVIRRDGVFDSLEKMLEKFWGEWGACWECVGTGGVGGGEWGDKLRMLRGEELEVLRFVRFLERFKSYSRGWELSARDFGVNLCVW